MSWVTYILETAGTVTVEAILPGEPGMRSFRAGCAPAVMSLAHSAVASASDTTIAGEPCTLTIKQRDRYWPCPLAGQLQFASIADFACCTACVCGLSACRYNRQAC